jgi:hypothetical protein
MLWECFAAGRTGALHKIDGIMRKKLFYNKLRYQKGIEIVEQPINGEHRLKPYTLHTGYSS